MNLITQIFADVASLQINYEADKSESELKTKKNVHKFKTSNIKKCN